MGLLYHKTIIRILSITAGLFMLYYIGWRGAQTLNPDYYFFSLLLLIAEGQGVLNFFLFTLMTWDTGQNRSPRPKYTTDKTIDVFVPTYNEEIEVLEATLVGCINMRLPHRTYVLDDGRRPHIKELAERLGCHYLTRADNKHAKAGNINAALEKTSGDIIAIFDADMVPQPDFLEKTVGYFEDERVAIVQLPQEFYNRDSVQHSDDWHEQQLFYRVIQPGKDNIGATFWCGSPSVICRRAFEEIGGVATETITEDFQTSIRLNAKGWKIRFHNENLAYGIAPQSLQAFNLQRLRWAQGAMQIFRSKDNPLAIKGLTWQQRLSHFSAIFTYFDSYQKLIYLLAPVLYLLFGILPIRIDDSGEFIVNWSLYFLFTLGANIAMGRGYFKYFAVEKYNILKMFTFIRASVIIIWPRVLGFKVTPKGADQSIKQKDRAELKLHVVLLILMALAFVSGLFHLAEGGFAEDREYVNVGISLFWLIMNGTLLFVTVRQVLKRLYYRQDYRFPLQVSGSLTLSDGTEQAIRVRDISRYGLGLEFEAPFRDSLDENVSIRLHTDGDAVYLPGKIRFDLQLKGKRGVRKMGIRFHELTEHDQDKLVYFLFVTMPKQLDEHARQQKDLGRERDLPGLETTVTITA